MNAAADFINKINDAIINPLIIFLTALAILLFLWGVFQFVRKSDSDEGRTTGQQHMLWGVIGLAIMLGVYGLIRIVLATFGIDSPV